ncbi:PucR-like helix-turn-helix protein [Thermomonospora umbrina]|uniref:PucR-like helix-turn-helix protein n=1 Tax=Thermomonospora umbrina TaxID=111806 RepID=A0A3D9SIR9_9ACTN|nr:PucR-like helix-turn-helix protein [Thermomonospora umbrina]
MGYQALVDEVSALLQAPATLEDREFSLIAFSSHDDDLDPVRTRSILSRRSSAAVRAWFEGFGIARADGPVHTPPDPATGVRSRLCLPARHEGRTYGYLWLLDDGTVDATDPRVAKAMSLAARAGRLLAAEFQADEAAPRAFARLLSASPEDRADGAATLSGMGHPAASSPIAVVVIRPTIRLTRVPMDVLVHHTAGGAALLVPLHEAADTVPARSTATRLLGTTPWVTVGVGGGRAGVVDAVGSWHEARTAWRVARAVPEVGPVACWDALGVHRLIASLPGAAPGAAVADPAVRPLFEDAHADLLRTAEVYLDHAGHAQQAAAALSVHRQTLYYRLSRIEAITGLAFDSGEDRLLLHTALKAARLAAVPDPM